MSLRCLPSSFGSIRLTVWEEISFEEWWPSWIFASPPPPHTHTPQLPPPTNQVSAQSDLWFGRRCRLKNFKMAAMAEMILAILNLYVTVMPPIKFQLYPTYGLGGDVV